MPLRHRIPTLIAVWLAAAVGVALNLTMGPLPAWLATSFYLAMGWGGVWCYIGMRPSKSHWELIGVPLGGILYSVGAIFHVLKKPVLWPGVFGAHELFHLFVIAGALAHFTFVLTHVAAPKSPQQARDRSRHGIVVLGPPRPRFLGQKARRRLVVRVKRSEV